MKKLFIILIISLLITSPASALSESVLDMLDKNGIYYYKPGGFSDSCYPAVGSYDGVATAGLSDTRAAFVDKYHDIAANLGAEYGIPWEAVMAQGILESASGTSNFAVNRNNFFGIGAVDSNPGAARSYSSAGDGWKGYFEFIRNNPRYEKAGAFNYSGDPYGYIAAIKSAGYATDPNYVAKLSPIIKAIQNRAAEKGWDASSITSPSSSYYHDCTSSAAVAGNGDLNATALALSWATRGHAIDDPTAAYATALHAVGLDVYSDDFVKMGASCDAFVATVLRYSGADPNVPCCGTSRMLNYFASHPEKYVEVPNIGNPSNLQGGDIRVKDGHIEMYITDENGQGRIASASHGDRTADHSRGYYTDSSYRIFRLKGAA